MAEGKRGGWGGEVEARPRTWMVHVASMLAPMRKQSGPRVCMVSNSTLCGSRPCLPASCHTHAETAMAARRLSRPVSSTTWGGVGG